MKKPEEKLTRGSGNFIHCTDYEEAIDTIKEHAQECAIEFLEWTLINGWRKLDGIWEFSDGDSHRTTKELYILFESTVGGN